MPPSPDHVRSDPLIATLESLHAEALRLEQQLAPEIEAAHEHSRASARNLAHYLALRSHDMRELQFELAALGLSSLGRTEAQVLWGIESVLAALYRSSGREIPARRAAPLDFQSGPALLSQQAASLLGAAPRTRATRIMATLPTEAGSDPARVRELVAAGVDLVRINCAHDDARVWQGMLRNLETARSELGRECRVLFDLGGPKLRTGALPPGPRVLHAAPPHDARGVPLRPLRVWLVPSGMPSAEVHDCDARVPLEGGDWAALRPGQSLCFADTRGRERQLRLVEPREPGWIAECTRSFWLEDGMQLECAPSTFRVSGLASEPGELRLVRGESFWLVAEGARGPQDGRSSVPCTLPAVLGDLRAGERVCFDDGKLEGRVVELVPDAVRVEVVQARAGGEKLRADKGINLPDSELCCTGLTAQDRLDLDFVARHADLVGLSFVRSPEDVLELQRELALRTTRAPGILVKIETRQAFEALPRILLAGMRARPFGVMVARGDLAVEVGFERLAEVQEEILWLCEAAHVPVIWATQVLDSLTRKGRPSRAEVTDAAMSVRSECVMLNKGPHAAEAVRFLDDVLLRMQQHHSKKRSLLRRLSVSDLGRAARPSRAPRRG
jgi:pyruvate kinase